MNNTYDNFGPVEFITDDVFLKHHLSPTPESGRFWKEYLSAHPHKNQEWQEAKELLDAVLLGLKSYSRIYISEEEEARLLDRIMHTNNLNASVKVASISKNIGWYRMAAACIAFVILGVGYLALNLGSTHKASYAETISALEHVSKVSRHINVTATPEIYYLPDSSQVILDPKSEVSFTSDYNQEKRSVYLSGKAVLEVVPNAAKPFYVFANEVVTKVLGTKFEVVAFDNGSDVTVKVMTGKVTVYQNDGERSGADNNSKHSAILLLPNQLVVFDRKAELFNKRLAATPVILLEGKTQPKFEYEEAYASQFFEDIQKAYGVNVVYNPELFENCQFSAGLSGENMLEKLDVVCKTIGARYEVIDAQIVVTTTGCK